MAKYECVLITGSLSLKNFTMYIGYIRLPLKDPTDFQGVFFLKIKLLIKVLRRVLSTNRVEPLPGKCSQVREGVT